MTLTCFASLASADRLPVEDTVHWYSEYSQSDFYDYPVARNVWGFLEVMDPHTMPDKLEGGGLQSGLPRVFSSNGSSWTQNIYRLNGLDITDPVETGRPLFYPHLDLLNKLRLSKASKPASMDAPGSYMDLEFKGPGEKLTAEMTGFYTGNAFQGQNTKDPSPPPGVPAADRFKTYHTGTFAFGGPIGWSGVRAFGVYAQEKLARQPSGFSGVEDRDLRTGIAEIDWPLSQKESLGLTWVEQHLDRPQDGAMFRRVPSAASDRDDWFRIAQARWNAETADGTAWTLAGGFAQGFIQNEVQPGITAQPGREMFEADRTGSALFAGQSDRRKWNIKAEVRRSLDDPFGKSHRLSGGVDYRLGTAEEIARVQGDVQQLFLNGVPTEVIRYNTPVHMKEGVRDLNLWVQDHLQLTSRWSWDLGMGFVRSAAFLPPQSSPSAQFDLGRPRSSEGKSKVVQWNDMAPRAGFSYRLGHRRKTILKASYSRYPHTVPTPYARWGNPNALGGQVYAWNDANGDRQYQVGEEGRLLKNIGPQFSSVDPNAKRPWTEEFRIALDHAGKGGTRSVLSLMNRITKNPINLVNTGVPFSAFTPVTIDDPGDDFGETKPRTVWNQDASTLGQDAYFLTNPEPSNDFYQGLEVRMDGTWFERFEWTGAFSAYKSLQSANSGNGPLENDAGMLGDAYDNPNMTRSHFRRRPFFDRALIGQARGIYRHPRGWHAGAVFRYFDGTPFLRRLVVTGLNQGPIEVLTNPGGRQEDLRTIYQATVDVGAGYTMDLGGSRLVFALDVFNVFNFDNSTMERDLTGPDFLPRKATEKLSPRVFRLGFRYLFG